MLNYQRVHNLLGCTLLIISHSFCGKMTWDFHKLAQNLHQCSFTEVLKGRQSWPGMSKSGSGRWCRGIPLKIPLDSPSCESWLNCWDGTGSNWGSSPKIPSSQWKWPRKIRKRASLPGFLSKTLTWLTPNWPKPFPDSNSKYIWIYIYNYIYLYIFIEASFLVPVLLAWCGHPYFWLRDVLSREASSEAPVRPAMTSGEGTTSAVDGKVATSTAQPSCAVVSCGTLGWWA